MFFQVMNRTLIWSLSIGGNEITVKQTTNKWTWWKLLCCQRNSLKRYWKLQYLLEKFSILILMIRYALQQNLTRAVNSPVAFKSSFTSAVVRSFSVLTCSILVTRVCSLAFVNVWCKFCIIDAQSWQKNWLLTVIARMRRIISSGQADVKQVWTPFSSIFKFVHLWWWLLFCSTFFCVSATSQLGPNARTQVICVSHHFRSCLP